MTTMNITSAVGLHSYYADRLLAIMHQLKATPIVWQDVWDDKVQVKCCTTIVTLDLDRDSVAKRHHRTSVEGCQ
jgi:hypothetical protein